PSLAIQPAAPMIHFSDTFATAFGPFSVAVTEDSALAATVFGDTTALRARLGVGRLLADRARARAVREQVQAYGAGELRVFTLPLSPAGTTFQQRVWAALRHIPYGETRSYRDV